MRPQRVNVGRMRRYRERSRERYVWSAEERQELLDHMQRRVREMKAEDEPHRPPVRLGPREEVWFDERGGYHYGRRADPNVLPGVLYLDDSGAACSRPTRADV